MSHTFVLNHHILLRRRFPLNWKINLKIFWVLSFCLILSFSIFYVFQVNEMVKTNYLIKIYKEKIENLSQTNKTLEINFAHITSLENIGKQAGELNFEKIRKVKYIQILESSLVTK